MSKKHAFSEVGIIMGAPTKGGVYLIDKPGTAIYIGESGNIQDRLLEHYRKQSGQSACIWRNNPRTFSYEIVRGEAARKRREQELIRQLRPVCNR